MLMFIAVYHKKQLVYAFRESITGILTIIGVTLHSSTKVINYCQSSPNVSPIGGNYYGITGFALSHTINSGGSNNRWQGCYFHLVYLDLQAYPAIL